MSLRYPISISISGQSDNLFAGNASLLRNLPLKCEPRVDAGAVRGDVDQRPVPDLAQSRILGDQRVLILFEGTLDFAEQLLRRLRFVLAMAVGSRPNEPAGVLRFRRDAVEDAQPKAAV